jgi:hypothetical protein
MRFLRHFAVVVAALTLAAGAAWAGSTNRLGTSGAVELRLPVGARSIALAGADLASVNGVDALFYNPAGLAGSEHKTEVMFSNTHYIADQQINYVGVAQSMGAWGNLGVSAKVLSVGDIIETTETAPEGTGSTFSPTFSTLGLSYAKAMTDRVNFGGTLYYVAENVLQETAAGVVFDFGFQYDTGAHGARLGVALKNIGPNMQFSGADLNFITPVPGSDPQASGRNVTTESAPFELPTSLQMSIALPLVQGVNALNAYGAYNSNSAGSDQGRVGAEWSMRRLLALRAGYVYGDNDTEPFRFAYGLGLNVPVGGTHLRLDWAAQPMHGGYFDDVQNVSLAMSF